MFVMRPSLFLGALLPKKKKNHKSYDAAPTEAKIYSMYVLAIHMNALRDKMAVPLLSVTPCSQSKGETLSLSLTSQRATAVSL